MMENKIADLLKRLGITAYRFAKDTGISRNTVYLLRNNPRQFPSAEVLNRILGTYPGLTLNDIVKRSGNISELNREVN